MAIDVATFLKEFPEFRDAPTDLLEATLIRAQEMVPDFVWGSAGPDHSLTEQGTFLYCARFLALSPYARKLALVGKTGRTIYDDRLDQLKRTVSSGFRAL